MISDSTQSEKGFWEQKFHIILCRSSSELPSRGGGYRRLSVEKLSVFYPALQFMVPKVSTGPSFCSRQTWCSDERRDLPTAPPTHTCSSMLSQT